MTPNEQAKFVLIIIAVVALGFLAVNGFVKWRYYNRLMMTPCDICLEDNPELTLTQKVPNLVGDNRIIFQEDLLYNSTFDLEVAS